MIRATIDFRKKNRERCSSVLRKSLFFTSIENIKGEKEETRPYTIDLNIYYSDDDNVYQIYKDMDTIYHEFSKNIHIVKEMIGYQLFHNGVISNGYDIRCISTLGDILDQYYISVKMNRALFIINGSGVWGKDTFISFVQRNYVYTMSFSTIDPVRELLPELGIDVSNKTEADRLLLSNIKAAIMKYNPEWSRNQVYEHEKVLANNPIYKRYILFIHCREKEDIDRIKSLGAYTLLIKNNNVPLITSNESDKNVLKYGYDSFINKNIANYGYDFVIENNDDIETLEEKARKFAKTMDLFLYNEGDNI